MGLFHFSETSLLLLVVLKFWELGGESFSSFPYGINSALKTRWTRLLLRVVSRARGQCIARLQIYKIGPVCTSLNI